VGRYAVSTVFLAGNCAFRIAAPAGTVAIVAHPRPLVYLALLPTLFNSIHHEFFSGLICAFLSAASTIRHDCPMGGVGGRGHHTCGYLMPATGEGADRLLFALGASIMALRPVPLERRIRDRLPVSLARLEWTTGIDVGPERVGGPKAHGRRKRAWTGTLAAPAPAAGCADGAARGSESRP